MMNQQGYNPFTDDMKEISLDADKTSKAIQFVEDLIYKYNVTPVGEKSPIDDFKAGNVAMIIDGNWQLSGLSDVSFKWNTAEYPQIFDEKAVWGASELLAFPASKNPDENKQAAAREFVKWLSENSAQWALSGQIPANVQSQEDSEKLPGIDAFYAEMDYVKFLPANPLSVSLFSSKAPSPILTMAQDATLNNKDAGEITSQFEKDLNDVMKNN
jgi:multiple sugar transport system substrate-binding protein